MATREPGQRGGFRHQLTLLIAGTTIVTGTALLGLQYLIMAGVLTNQVRAISAMEIGSGQAGGPPEVSSTVQPTGVPAGSPGGTLASSDGALADLRGAVLQQTLLGSLALVVLLVALAAALSRLLAARLLSRVGEVTRLAQAVTTADLSRRLALSGPRDEIRELGDTFDGMLERLEQAFERQDRFIANASHELRTPLSANRLALEGPLHQHRVPADLEPELRRALAANERATRILDALLTLARSRRVVPADEPVDLAELARAAEGRLRTEVEARGIGVQTEIVDAVVPGSPVLLAQAVDNLVGNAAKYTPDGGLIRLTVAGGGAESVLSVENSGPVFTADEASRLREAFYRGTRTRTSAPGHGLGLALVDSIARTHGGSLALIPRSGGGLVALLRLPRWSGEKHDA